MKAQKFEVGQRVRVYDTFIYGTIVDIFDWEILYIAIDGLDKPQRYKTDEIRHIFPTIFATHFNAICGRFEDWVVSLFSERSEKRFTRAFYAFAGVFVMYLFIHFILSLIF